MYKIVSTFFLNTCFLTETILKTNMLESVLFTYSYDISTFHVQELNVILYMLKQYIVVYESSSDEFDIEHCQIKVKVTVGLKKFSLFTTIQTVRSYMYSSTLVQAMKLMLS